MPSVILRLFHPVLASLLISGVIAAMISTADSLLILSATELSESLLKKTGKEDDEDTAGRTLRRHRMTTAVLAIIALALSYFSPSDLIFTIVSYVWAGIGCTFSVVVLFSLFWKRFHGRAAIITVIAGMIFTIIWISGGFEQHYRVTQEKTSMLTTQNVITPGESKSLMALEGKKFVNKSRFESVLKSNTDIIPDNNKIAIISSVFTQKGVPARLTTFIFALVVAIAATYLIKPDKHPARRY
jgi:Na+/proline symporter